MPLSEDIQRQFTSVKNHITRAAAAIARRFAIPYLAARDIYQIRTGRQPSVEIQPEILEPPLTKIAELLGKAKKTINICMTKFTVRKFATVLINKSKKVKIRVVLDGKSANDPTSMKNYLERYGIEVRCSPPTEHMVNSYCLVDTGNPGQAGFVFENRDEIPPQGIVLTSIACWDETLESLSRPKVLKLVTEVVINIFHNEFEELWQRFAPPQ